MTERFGFHVYQEKDYGQSDEEFQQAIKEFIASRPEGHFGWAIDPDRPVFEPIPLDKWGISLPHQCDSWQITGSKDEEDYWQDVAGHEQAIADLERFIAEAQEALAALRERREYGEWL